MADPPIPPAGDPPAPSLTPPVLPDLGDAGKKALDEERTARKTAEKAAKAAQDELEKLRTQTMSDQEKAIAAAKAEGRDEALKTANERLVRAEVKAAAAGKLADPSDALALLDLDSFVDAKGEINGKAIADAIDRLVQSKPYLSAMPGNGSGEGGARGAGPQKPTHDPLLDAVQRAVGGARRS